MIDTQPGARAVENALGRIAYGGVSWLESTESCAKRMRKTRSTGKALTGLGGRWSSVGTRLAYTAGRLALAMIEYFIHIGPDHPPKDLVALTAEVPQSVSPISITGKQLSANWRQSPCRRNSL